MDFDLDDLNPGIWFYLDENDEKKGGVCVRSLNPETMKEMDRVTVKRRWKYNKGKRFEDVTIDEEKRELMQWDYCIVDWSDMNANGEPIPLTAENKVRLMNGSTRFAAFVAESIEAFNDMVDEDRAAATKN